VDTPSSVNQLVVPGGRLLGPGLGEERFVDVRDDTAASNSGLDEGVELLVTTDGELQVTRCDALDLEVLGGIAGQLENLGGEVLEDGSAVNSSRSADAALRRNGLLQEPVDTADRKLHKGTTLASTSASIVGLKIHSNDHQVGHGDRSQHCGAETEDVAKTRTSYLQASAV
jgi:hypothetical protein